MSTPTHIVIIGGGPAGYEAAIAGATIGAQITLIESEGVGGAAVLHDCVPSKSLIAGVGIKENLRIAEDMGLNDELKDIPLFLSSLNARVRGLALEQSTDVYNDLRGLGVRIIRGRARFDDYTVKQTTHYIRIDGTDEIIECDFVLIATGGRPRILPGAEPDGDRILTWQQVYDLDEKPEHLVVVGSGVTGAEFVSAFSQLGVPVTMVASRDRILPHDDADAANVLETALAERGVELVKHARVESVVSTGDGVVVRTDDGREIRGSHALMTVGSVPNTEELGLEGVGVERTPSGHIHVDRVSRTNVAGVYAAGDCTDIFPLASVAAMQGRIAMKHALGGELTPIRLKTVAQAVFTQPEIAAVGMTEHEIDAGDVSAQGIVLPLDANPRAKMQSLRHGFVKLFCRRHSGIVVGGVIVAPQASELILPISMAVANGLTVRAIANTFAVYPSLSGSITDAARRLTTDDDLE